MSIVSQNNKAPITMVNVHALIVKEIPEEEPGLSAQIMCIMTRRQNWRLNNTSVSWVTPSHKWSSDLYSRNIDPEQLLCVHTGQQAQAKDCEIDYSRASSEGGKAACSGMTAILWGEDDPRLWRLAQTASSQEAFNQKCKCHYLRTLVSF